MIKIIICKSMNVTPEDQVNESVNELGQGWRVVSASTVIIPWGRREDVASNFPIRPEHVFYATTIVCESNG